MKSLRELAHGISIGDVSSLALVEECVARATDPAGEGRRVYVRLHAEEARREAIDHEQRAKAGAPGLPLAGLPVSVKDLFDIAGQVTTAGSQVLATAAPAVHDATAVARLRAAGAILIGRTNMSEFAFSAVGLNPHYGTPGNPHDRSRIPGGSSSGGAVSVADDMAAAALCSDTGGSIRVPAALCGLVGFKPTAKRVPTRGIVPLSKSLDSVGPIARTVGDCALLDGVLSGEPRTIAPVPASGLRLGMPQTIVHDGMDCVVAASFEAACARLSRAGVIIEHAPFSLFAEIAAINARSGGFPPPEALAWHEPLLAASGPGYDPRARARFERGRETSCAEFIRLCWKREELIARMSAEIAPFDALVLPTCPVVAPKLDALEDDDGRFWEQNALLSRNCAFFNFLDCCAITIPMQRPGDLPSGLMLAAAGGHDAKLLAIAAAVEHILLQP